MLQNFFSKKKKELHIYIHYEFYFPLYQSKFWDQGLIFVFLVLL